MAGEPISIAGSRDDQLVERYVTGRMAEAELEAFELRLLEDAELLAQARAAVALRDGLRGLAGRQVSESLMTPALALAAVLSLAVALPLMTGRVSHRDTGSVVAPVLEPVLTVELALLRGGGGPLIDLRASSALELRPLVPGVALGGSAWRITAADGAVIASGVIGDGASRDAAILVQRSALPAGEYRLSLVTAELGELQFAFGVSGG